MPDDAPVMKAVSKVVTDSILHNLYSPRKPPRSVLERHRDLRHPAHPVRIAILTTSYPSREDDPCGHFVRASALDLSSQGHEVHVIAPSSAVPSLPMDPGIVLRPVPHAGVFGWPGAATRLRHFPWRAPGALAFAWFAARTLQDLRPDRVVAHWLVPSAFPIACRLPGNASLHCVAHGADVRLLLASPAAVREHVVSSILSRSTRVQFVATALLHTLRAALSPELRSRLDAISFVRPCPVRIPDVSLRASELKREFQSQRLITAVGRLVPSKRIDLAIEAANLLGARTRLQVIGDGPDQDRLRSLDCLGNVGFAGRLDRRETLAWVAASAAVIHASGVEAAPTVVREARLLDVPVVACDAGDVSLWARQDAGIHLVSACGASIARVVGRLVGGG